jgi:hypothetical protein
MRIETRLTVDVLWHPCSLSFMRGYVKAARGASSAEQRTAIIAALDTLERGEVVTVSGLRVFRRVRG